MNVILTGVAGFIGFHLAERLMGEKTIKNIIAIDNLNEYYDVQLKKNRIKKLRQNKNSHKLNLSKIDINDYKKLLSLTKKFNVKIIYHLAAQAGIRYSFINPKSYIDSNINGFFNIIELARHLKIEKLIYASSSSAYGNNKKAPYTEESLTNEPLQLYAATKISNEVMAFAYSHLYKFHSIGLRFFTVYGPYGRPDMAIYKFVDSIFKNRKINLYDKGLMQRDFTYIDDIIEAILKLSKKNKIQSKSKENNFHSIYNLGRGKPIKINELIKKIEKLIGKKAKIFHQKSNNAEMKKTHSSMKKFKKDFNFSPEIRIDEGLKLFIKWYISYYKIK